MEIIPKYFFNDKKKYHGELFVAEILKKINLSKKDYLLHSQNMMGGDRQVWSEIDFVIITERAILGVEVKSGPVRFIDGRYHIYRDKNCLVEAYEPKVKSPLVQASGGLFKLKDTWFKDYKALKNIPFIAIAILAKNQRKIVDFPEMQNEFCIYEEDLIHEDLLKEKLNQAIDFYIKNYFTRVPEKLTEKSIEEVKNILRPEIDKSPVDIDNQIKQINYLQHSLTEDQYKIIDRYSDNKRILVDGGAGTGKTFLLFYLLRGEYENYKNIAIVSKANRLMKFIQSRCSYIKNIDFINSTNIELSKKYDLIYIDEAQDFCNQDDYIFLDGILESGIENSTWRIFGDFENQFKLRDDFDKEVFNLLLSHTENTYPIPLHHNVRNTPKIVKTLEAFSKARMGVTLYKGAGPEPEKITPENLREYLCNNSLGIQDFADVAVLYHEDYINNNNLICILDCMQNLIAKGVTFCNYEDFKGMEANYVFILGLDKSTDLQNFRDNFYKTISRARVYCYYLGSNLIDKFLVDSYRG